MTKKRITYRAAISTYQELVIADKHEEIVYLLYPFLKSKKLDAEKKLRLKTVLAVSLNKLFKHHEAIDLLSNCELDNFSSATLIQYYFTLVDTYYCILDIEHAYRNTILAMKLAVSMNDTDQIGVAHNYLGSIYNMMEDNRNAIIHFIKCIRIYKQNNLLEGRDFKIATTYNNIANCLIELNKNSWAKSLIDKSLLINKQDIQSNQLFIQSYLYQTNIYIQLKEYSLAAEAILKLKNIFLDNNDFEKIFDIKLYDFKLLFLQNLEKNKQKQLLIELETLSHKILPSNKLLKYYDTLSNYFLYKENYKKAFLYKEKYILLTQQLNNTALFNKIKQLQIQYELETIQLEKNRVEQIALAKQDFLMQISHEIRSPLNVVIGALDLIQLEQKIARQKKFVTIAHQGATNLLSLLNDILDNAKIEAGKFTIHQEPFCVNNQIDEVISLFELSFAQKKLLISTQLDIPKNLWIIGDAKRFNQILINLVSNTLKYTNVGGVEVAASLFKNNKIIIDVKDSGLGIKKEDIPFLFKAFQQTNNSNQQKNIGTGLGLMIAKKLCVLMNGDLFLLKSNLKGSTFRIELPINKTKPVGSVKKNKPIQLNPNLKIIIADDILENRTIVKELLLKNNKHIAIDEAIDGKDLLSKTNLYSYNLVIVDLDMPIMNGFQFIEQFRKKKNNTKIIAMTASLLSIPKNELLGLGFDELILKPFKPNDLIEIINHLVI